ncbi:hypothetical protein D3C78_1614050 [compost metagenome]
MRRPLLPVSLFLQRIDQRDRTRVFQILQAESDRILPGMPCQFINPRLMGEHVGQRRHPAHPGSPNDWRSVLANYSHVRIFILWNGGSVAHLLYVGPIGHLAGQYQ